MMLVKETIHAVWSPRREKEADNLFKEIMSENFPKPERYLESKFMKFIYPETSSTQRHIFGDIP